MTHDKNGNLHALFPKNVWVNRSEFEPPFCTSLIPPLLESWVIYPALLVIRFRDNIFLTLFSGAGTWKIVSNWAKKSEGSHGMKVGILMSEILYRAWDYSFPTIPSFFGGYTFLLYKESDLHVSFLWERVRGYSYQWEGCGQNFPKFLDNAGQYVSVIFWVFWRQRAT